MHRMIDGIFRQYGTAMTVKKNGQTTKVRAFFQPVRSKSLHNMEDVALPLGLISRSKFVYIGPAQVQVAMGDLVTVGKKTYVFCSVEPFYYENEPAYLWGLCTEGGEGL